MFSYYALQQQETLQFLKRIQLIAGILLLVSMTVAIALEYFIIVLVLGILLMLLLVFIRALNFNFIRIILENNKLIIRYYALYSVDRSYESVEFPVSSLRKSLVKKYLFGLKWDLYLTVKLKKGMASYPPICLSAIPLSEREKLLKQIRELISTGQV